MAPSPAKKTSPTQPAPQPTAQASLLERLNTIAKAFDKAPVVEAGSTLPEGVYQAKLVKVTDAISTYEGPTKGCVRITLKFEVVEGDLAGRTFNEGFTMSDDEAMGRFKARVGHLGYANSTVEECAAGLQDAIEQGNVYEYKMDPYTGKDGKARMGINFVRIVESAADRETKEALETDEIDEQGAEEAEAPPKVQQVAKTAPAQRATSKPSAAKQTTKGLIDSLPD